MRKALKIFSFAISFLFFSCSAPKTIQSNARVLSIESPQVVVKPTAADLIVNEKKTSGVAKGKAALLQFVKQQAIADALKKSQSDVLVEPEFVVVQKFGKVTVTATGFPAKYSNFRTIQPQDSLLLASGKAVRLELETSQPEQLEDVKKKPVLQRSWTELTDVQKFNTIFLSVAGTSVLSSVTLYFTGAFE